MKTKFKKFIQYLSHDIEDEDLAAAYLNDSLPRLGFIVMGFNAIELSLNSFICEIISDRSDEPGLIVIDKLMFSAKLDLFKRLSFHFHQCSGCVPHNFDELIIKLSEIAKLLNLAVHAEWNNTDEEGYTFIRLKKTNNGLMQEYVQFSVESLEQIMDKIITVNHLLANYWEWRSDNLASNSSKPYSCDT